MTQERLEHRRPQHHHPLPSAAGGRHLCHPTTPHRSHVVRPHVDDALHTHMGQLVQERSGAASVAAAHARARVCHFQATQVQPQLHARKCGAPETVPATWVFPTPATARHNRTHSQRAHGPQLRAGGTHPNTARARTRKPATPQLRHTARHTTHNRRCAPHNAPSTTAVRQRTPARRAAENRRGATHTHPTAGRVVRARALPKTKQPRELGTSYWRRSASQQGVAVYFFFRASRRGGLVVPWWYVVPRV